MSESNQYQLTFNLDEKHNNTSNKKRSPYIRKLDEGEFSNVEGKYSLDKNFSFYGRDKIYSYDDVAFIFRQLQKSSVENLFLLHVLENDKPFIQHLSMGDAKSTIFNHLAVHDSINRFNSKKVYFVHNHPSGKLIPSNADFNCLKYLKNFYGDKVASGVIINVTSGKYSVFFNSDYYEQNFSGKSMIPDKKFNVYKFDRHVFKENVNFHKVTGPGDAAMFASSQRFSENNKLSLMILSNANLVNANIHLNYSNFNNINELKKDIILHCSRFQGSAVIIYGKNNELSKNLENNMALLNKMKEELKSSSISVLDIVMLKSTPELDIVYDNEQEYFSASQNGLFEADIKYNTDEKMVLPDDYYSNKDSYVYRGTDTPVNNANIKDFETFLSWENALTEFQEGFFISKYNTKNNVKIDENFFKNIHYEIFKHVYSWAGEYRKIPLMDNPLKNYPQPGQVNKKMDYFFSDLRKDNYLRPAKGEKLNKPQFISLASKYMYRLNKIKPFFRGNERVERAFFSQLCKQAGYHLDWSKTSQKELVNTYKKSHKEPKAFESLFSKIIADKKLENVKNI